MKQHLIVLFYVVIGTVSNYLMLLFFLQLFFLPWKYVILMEPNPFILGVELFLWGFTLVLAPVVIYWLLRSIIRIQQQQ